MTGTELAKSQHKIKSSYHPQDCSLSRAYLNSKKELTFIIINASKKNTKQQQFCQDFNTALVLFLNLLLFMITSKISSVLSILSTTELHPQFFLFF